MWNILNCVRGLRIGPKLYWSFTPVILCQPKWLKHFFYFFACQKRYDFVLKINK
jgi:hypothetical protein